MNEITEENVRSWMSRHGHYMARPVSFNDNGFKYETVLITNSGTRIAIVGDSPDGNLMDLYEEIKDRLWIKCT